MDPSKVRSLVDQLEDNIDDLEDCLHPLMSQALSESTNKLPLLDKAKLHIVIVYAIESLLFSYLKVNDIDPKEHPVFRELTRVKQYFEKVKNAEEGPPQPREHLSLNKQAAARIIKHSLAGNDKLDLARLEREAREKLLAKRKLKDLESTMREKAQDVEQLPQSVEQTLVDQIAAEIEEAEAAPDATQVASEIQDMSISKKEKKRKRKGEEHAASDSANKKKSSEAKAARKARKKARKETQTAQQTPG